MYGILSLIKSLHGRPAMKRVMEVMRKYPEHRLTRAVKNEGAPPWWYEGGRQGNRGGYSEASRLGAAEQILNRSSSFLNPHPGTFMNYVRHKVKNPKMFSDLANWMRLNPEKRKIMDEWYQETGGNTPWSAGFMDRMIQDSISDMARTNFTLRQLTDHEKYLLAVAKQRRQQALQEQAKILPFPKKKFNTGGLASLMI
ncbi:hypothetical protein C9439_02095 [archaeon SCG-AAA382B04]|nr:hypothetical protein C9439_02095 [archaeon SCG-AAA382B04]